MLAGDMDTLLNELDEREKKILQMRFGLNGERPLTLEEVGQRIGLPVNVSAKSNRRQRLSLNDQASEIVYVFTSKTSKL